MIKTCKDLITWIDQNVPKGNLGSSSAVDAAYWFVAIQVAMVAHDLSIKELAHDIQAGIGPIDESDDITAYIELYYADPEVPDDDPSKIATQAQLLEDLEAHFGLSDHPEEPNVTP